ncbi:hypothetical protein ID866_6041 [Astraeus odoratus]|nr:hypothetical protein ID866_6041 [Astraeus odoratus]
MTRPPDRPSDENTCSRMSDDWWSICRRCWDYEPSSRPSIETILNEIEQKIVSPLCGTSYFATEIMENKGPILPCIRVPSCQWVAKQYLFRCRWHHRGCDEHCTRSSHYRQDYPCVGEMHKRARSVRYESNKGRHLCCRYSP